MMTSRDVRKFQHCWGRMTQQDSGIWMLMMYLKSPKNYTENLPRNIYQVPTIRFVRFSQRMTEEVHLLGAESHLGMSWDPVIFPKVMQKKKRLNFQNSKRSSRNFCYAWKHVSVWNIKIPRKNSGSLRVQRPRFWYGFLLKKIRSFWVKTQRINFLHPQPTDLDPTNRRRIIYLHQPQMRMYRSLVGETEFFPVQRGRGKKTEACYISPNSHQKKHILTEIMWIPNHMFPGRDGYYNSLPVEQTVFWCILRRAIFVAEAQGRWHFISFRCISSQPSETYITPYLGGQWKKNMVV